MNSIKVCEYSWSRSFHDDLILQDQASGERSQDQWSSGIGIGLKLLACCFVHRGSNCVFLLLLIFRNVVWHPGISSRLVAHRICESSF